MVIGAGKTGMDAVIHLLKEGIDANDIRWIMPNDSFITDRDEKFYGYKSIVEGGVYPFDSTRDYSNNNYKCATLSRAEYRTLTTVKNIVRKGRVSEVTEDSIILRDGSIPITKNSVLVDCTTNGLTPREATPVFVDK